MLEDKQGFVKRIKLVLIANPRSGVEDIEYISNYENSRLEVVEIKYQGGGKAKINVTANSLGAIFREIGAEVYGAGATGRFF